MTCTRVVWRGKGVETNKMTLENKLGIVDSALLAKEEERISK